jgi:hypothetical protein
MNAAKLMQSANKLYVVGRFEEALPILEELRTICPKGSNPVQRWVDNLIGECTQRIKGGKSINN